MEIKIHPGIGSRKVILIKNNIPELVRKINIYARYKFIELFYGVFIFTYMQNQLSQEILSLRLKGNKPNLFNIFSVNCSTFNDGD